MLNAVRAWILISALFVAAGWILSAFQELNGLRYCVVLALAAAAALWRWRGKLRPSPENLSRAGPRLRRRCKRFLPLFFFALVLLTLLSGALYAPLNGSSSTYRIPRTMHWLAAEHWHWIRTLDVRTNIAGCNFEWLCAPLILLTHTDRFLFLINWISFLLLPGLIFSVFTRLGVRPRVAWWWMWLLPSSWCFIMQAGSTINDALAAPYALAAVDLALRARQNKRLGDVWLALLAAALATGVKQTDILLAAPALIALWPVAGRLRQRPLASLAVVAMCLLISALPMIIFDLQHTGSWSGVTPASWAKTDLHSPLWGIVGNTFLLAVQSLKPPVFPFFNAWNAAMQHFLQTPLGSHFTMFENFGHLSFGIAESSAGIGTGIFLLALISLWWAWRHRRTPRAAVKPGLSSRVLRWTPWALMLALMTKIGTYENERLFASYYFLLFPSFLVSTGQSVLVRRRWWQWAALLVMAVAVMMVVVSRDRPLFPAETLAGRLQAEFPGSKLIANIARTYSAAPDFARQRAFFEENLPDRTVLGYAAQAGLAESNLWLPYGSRRVERILPGDTPQQLRARGIHYVVVEDFFLRATHDILQQWLARYHGVLLKQGAFLGDPYEPPQIYYLVRLENS